MSYSFTRKSTGNTLLPADVNNLQIALESTSKGVYNVMDYGAVPMTYYADGVATGSSTTFTSATAAFVNAAGQYIYIIKGSNGSGTNDANTQNIALTTTYTYSGSGTTITLAASPGRTLNPAKFYIGTDQTSAIQAACDACKNAGGGIVMVPGFFMCGPITLGKSVRLEGLGKMASRLIRPASSAAAAPHVTNLKSTETAEFCAVRHICLDGNGSNQTNKTGSYGIQWGWVTDWTQNTTYDELFDSWQLAEHVMILNTADTGCIADGAQETRWIDVYVYYSQNCGFQSGSDSFLHMCTSAETVNQGFYFVNNSIRMTNCKAFFAGRRGGRTPDVTGVAGDGSGFFFDNITQGAITLSSCEAQDNAGAGFYFHNSTRATLTACVADSNSALLADWLPAYYFDGATDNILEDCISFDRFATGQTTAWALLGTRCPSAVSFRGSAARNHVSITHSAGSIDGVNFATMGPPVKATGSLASNSTANNDLRFNNQLGMQTVAWASTMTINPYLGGYILFGAMTSAATINFLTGGYAHPGQRVMMEFTQDATANTHTITWGAGIKGGIQPTFVSGKISSVEFIFDGTSWIQFGSTLNM